MRNKRNHVVMKLVAAAMTIVVFLTPNSAAASPFAIDVDAVVQPADAEPLTTFIDEGQRAPFAGTLLNPTAAAAIVAERETNAERCTIAIDRAVELKRAEMQLEVDLQAASLAAAQQRLELQRELSDDRLAALDAELMRAQRAARRGDWNAAWFTGGVLTGVLIIVAGAFVVKGVRESTP